MAKNQEPSMFAMHQVTVNETWKRQRHKHGAGDGVKLPPLWRNLTGMFFKAQAHSTDNKIQHHHFGKSPKQGLRISLGSDQENPLVGKRQISRQQCQQHQKTYLHRSRHGQR